MSVRCPFSHDESLAQSTRDFYRGDFLILLDSAWLSCRLCPEKGTSWKISALLVAIALIFLHLKTKAILENELASAARAFGNFFLELELLRPAPP